MTRRETFSGVLTSLFVTVCLAANPMLYLGAPHWFTYAFSVGTFFFSLLSYARTHSER